MPLDFILQEGKALLIKRLRVIDHEKSRAIHLCGHYAPEQVFRTLGPGSGGHKDTLRKLLFEATREHTCQTALTYTARSKNKNASSTSVKRILHLA